MLRPHGHSCSAILCAALLLAGCSNSEPDPKGGKEPQEKTWNAERAELGKQLAEAGLTLPYIQGCAGGNQAMAVVAITGVRDHGGGLHTDRISQCHFRPVEVLRPGSDEQGGSIWDYHWFAYVPRPGLDENVLKEGATVLVVLDFNVSRWPESERIVPVDGSGDPRIGELKTLLKEIEAGEVQERKPWQR